MTIQTKIMLVDDDNAVREVIGEMLSRKGWLVSEFSDAEQALCDLGSNRYSLILADINMPGLNGMEFLERAKELACGVPVVMITGYPSIDLAVEAMKIGAVDFLSKPFKAEELEITVRKAIDGASVFNSNPTASESDAGLAVRAMPDVARHRLEDKIKELSILHTISETLDDVTEREEIYSKTMGMGLIIADATSAFIMAAEHGGSEFAIRASVGFGAASPVTGIRVRADEEPFRSVIKNRCYSYLIPDDDMRARFCADASGGPRRRPLLLVPMMINKEALLLLGLNCRERALELKSDAVALLSNLAAKASLKLENIALSENIFSSIVGAIDSLINALDAKDTYTKDHSNRVTQYALRIAGALGCNKEVINSIGFAGPLHDIGKIGVRDEILMKKGGFTINERELMRLHVLRGEEILRPLNLMSTEKEVVLYHHERWDGNGYPNGLSARNIPLAARVFSVADTYDAMTSTRPYRSALSAQVARDEIWRCKGTQFDPEVVNAFMDCGILTPSDVRPSDLMIHPDRLARHH